MGIVLRFSLEYTRKFDGIYAEGYQSRSGARMITGSPAQESVPSATVTEVPSSRFSYTPSMAGTGTSALTPLRLNTPIKWPVSPARCMTAMSFASSASARKSPDDPAEMYVEGDKSVLGAEVLYVVLGIVLLVLMAGIVR